MKPRRRKPEQGTRSLPPRRATKGEGLSLCKRVLLQLLVFALPLLFSTNNTSYNPIKITFALVSIALMLAVWWVESVRTGRFAFHGARLLLPLAVVSLAMAVSMLQAANAKLSVESMVYFLCFSCFVLYAANTLRHGKDGVLTLCTLLTAAVIVSSYGLMQYYGVVDSPVEYRIRAESMASTMGNKNYVGGFLAYGIWPGLALFLSLKSFKLKVGALLALWVVLSAIMTIDSDSVWLALIGAAAVGLGCTLAFKLTAPFRKNGGWLLALAALMALSFWLQGEAPWPLAFSQEEQAHAVSSYPVVEQWTDASNEGIYAPPEGLFRLEDKPGGLQVQLELLGGIPVVGDWLGDGRARLGIYQEGSFRLDLDLDGSIDLAVPFGEEGDLPVTGDWNGDGLTDLGVYRAAEGMFMLGAGLDGSKEAALVHVPDAHAGDWPVAGDWAGTGQVGVGLYRPEQGLYLLDANRDGVIDRQLRLAHGDIQGLPIVSERDGRLVFGLYDSGERAFLWDEDGDGTIDRKHTWGQPPWHEKVFNFIYKESARIRLQNWLIAWEMFKSNPWSGVGLGHYGLSYFPYKARILQSQQGQQLEAVELEEEVGSIPRAEHSHNEYVQVGAEMGLLGLLALAFALFRIGALALRGMSQAPGEGSRLLVLGALLGLCSGGIDALASFPLYLPASALELALLLGIVVSPMAQGEMPLRRRSKRAVWMLGLGAAVSLLVIAPLALRNFQADLDLREGIKLLGARNFARAESKLQDSVNLAFVPRMALYMLGFFYQIAGKPAACLQYEGQSLTTYVTERTYWYLGKCHWALEEFDQAFGYFQQAAQVDPADSLKRELREQLDEIQQQAHDHWNAGRPEQALQWMDAAAAIAAAGDLQWGKQPQAEYQRARWRIQSGLQGGTDAAVQVLTALLERDPGDIPAHLELAQLQGSMSHASLALELAQRRLQGVEYQLSAAGLEERRVSILHDERDQLQEWQRQAQGSLAKGMETP